MTERRTMVDFRSSQMRWLADDSLPSVREDPGGAGQPQHPQTSFPLRNQFEPKEARRIRKRLEFHYTPKHGSWLNMAEIYASSVSWPGESCAGVLPMKRLSSWRDRGHLGFRTKPRLEQTLTGRSCTVDARGEASRSAS